MTVSYGDILRKVDSGEIKLLEGIVKSKLGEEYKMSDLEQITTVTSVRDRTGRVPLRSMRYSSDRMEIINLQRPEILMGVYLRVLSVKDGKISTKDVHLGDYSWGDIAQGLSKFRGRSSVARNELYLRLQTLKDCKDISDYCKNCGSGIVLFDEEPPSSLFEADARPLFEVDLYQELAKAAKELFSG